MLLARGHPAGGKPGANSALISYTVLVTRSEAMGLGHFLPSPALLQLLFPVQAGRAQPQGSLEHLPPLSPPAQATWIRLKDSTAQEAQIPVILCIQTLEGDLPRNLCVIQLPSQGPG